MHLKMLSAKWRPFCPREMSFQQRFYWIVVEVRSRVGKHLDYFMSIPLFTNSLHSIPIYRITISKMGPQNKLASMGDCHEVVCVAKCDGHGLLTFTTRYIKWIVRVSAYGCVLEAFAEHYLFVVLKWCIIDVIPMYCGWKDPDLKNKWRGNILRAESNTTEHPPLNCPFSSSVKF